MPGEPATTATALAHLWVSRSRGASAAVSASSMSATDGRATGTPMSATCTRPLADAPFPMRRPGFSAANVTVRSAPSTRPGASPVSPFTPEGMSTASTSTPGASSGAS